MDFIDGAVVTLDFYTYVKDVLPNEWGYDSTWKSESLKAGAMAVKMYGWYNVYHPIYSGINANVYDNTNSHVFIVNSEKTSTTQAINDVGGIGMETYMAKQLFVPSYRKGTYSSSGYHGGILYQEGSRYLADQGNGYVSILKYYYDASSTLNGQILNFFFYTQ